MSNRESQIARWKKAWSTDGWARPFFKQYRKALIASILLGVLTMVFAVGLMFTSGYLICDAAERPELGLFSLLIPLGLVQVFGIGKPFLGYLERLTSHDWVLHIVSSMRVKLFDTIESHGMFWAATYRIGDMLGLLVEDIDHVQNLYLRVLFPQIIACVLWLGAALVFGFFSPLFALVIFTVLGVLTLVVPLAAAMKNGAQTQRRKQLINEFYAQSMDDMIGVDDWRFAHRKADFVDRIKCYDVQIDALHAQLAASERKRNVVVEVIFGVTTVAILAWAASCFGTMQQAGAMQGMANRPSEWIAAFVIGFFPLLEAFSPLSDAAVSGSAHLDSFERLNDLKPKASSEATQQTPVNFDIDIAHLSFTHESSASANIGSLPALFDISLHLAHGTKLAILGPSGAGKTTLLSLIHGDRKPTSGSLALGGIAPADLGTGICQYIGYVSQDTYLFNQSLFDNIAMNRPGITQDDVREALAAVGLGDLLASLPKGLATIVDESGMRFSGGERQRIAIARVLLQRCPIIIMDEPTVSLDPATEKNLLDTIFDVLSDRTIVLVTHHLTGIEHVDDVLFLKQGRVFLQGSPSALSDSSSYFRMLQEFDIG